MMCLFTSLGFILSSALTAILIAYKLTGDIYPKCLKLWFLKLCISNWASKSSRGTKPPGTSGSNYNTLNPSSTQETGIVPSQEEIQIERPASLISQDQAESLSFYGVDPYGNFLWTQFTRKDFGNSGRLVLILSMDGVEYKLEKSGELHSKMEFDFGNFRMECVEPMRCWRVWFNGAMEKTRVNDDAGDEENLAVHVVINSLWKPFDSPIDAKRGCNVELLAKYMSSSGLGENLADSPNLVDSGSASSAYIQYGAFHGTITIDENERDEPFYLYGFRTKKFFKESPHSDGYPKQTLEFFGYTETIGNSFRLFSSDSKEWTDGQISYSSDICNKISDTDFQISKSLPKAFRIVDGKAGKVFTIEIFPEKAPEYQSSKCKDLRLVPLRLMINGEPGRGILIGQKMEYENNGTIGTNFSQSPCLKNELEKPHILSLDSKLCQNPSLVGGKGASLAKLLNVQEVKYKTAKGFCLTTSLFRELLNLSEIDEIFRVRKEKSNLADACSSVINHIKTKPNATSALRPFIQKWIQQTFDNESSRSIRLAIRSSGILEDGSELSCAGQNETFLGVKADDIEQVVQRIVDCWCSLFTAQSVQYRLNHGQPLVTEMGVVVQEMVNAQSAGVCFTADPRTGNPFRILINGNWGLGESVVSASCDPDTIMLERSRSRAPPNSLKIHSKTLGTKKSKILLSDSESESFEILSKPEESTAYCLTDEAALKLGSIAIVLEAKMGKGKGIDVEWALGDNSEIYILQVRPITSLDSWTDFELIHESDTPLRTIRERLTNANTGEVMPGATSPLSLSIVTRFLDVGIQRRFTVRTGAGDQIVPHVLRSTNISRHQVLLNVLNTFCRSNDREITPAQVAMDLSIFGHRVLDKELHGLGVGRFGYMPGLQKLRELCSVIKTIFYRQKREVEIAMKNYQNYAIHIENAESKTSQELYGEITEKIFDLYNIFYAHCGMSEASGSSQTFVFLTLAGGMKSSEEWSNELLEDASKIFSVCMDVESADMPTAMDKLADIILEHSGAGDGENISILETDFLQAPSPLAAFEWLRNHKEKIVQDALDNFFVKHGHRCIGELDLMKNSWESDPAPFVQLIQNLVKNKLKFSKDSDSGVKLHGKTGHNHNDVDSLISSLNTEISWIGKRFLKFILPYCRNAVWNREKTKSLAVRTANEFKKILRVLGQRMVAQGFIPDSNLLFFMSHYQVGQVLRRDGSSVRILNKAMRKMKLHPLLSQEFYPEITIGLREPRKYSTFTSGDSEDPESEITIQGTPVSTGAGSSSTIRAPVKVCLTIEEASQTLQAGDILITIGTDIGWSPFFPILGGIVTELGGLISHGAVVAREYGLPCIVGAVGATRAFRRVGDIGILDAKKGTIMKIKSNQ